MKFNATINLTPQQVRNIIIGYFEHQGIKNISDQDIQFIVGEVDIGNQRDPMTTISLTGVAISNISIGEE